MNKRSGFTLAEILITLTIIGVVSSMTIPTMVQNIQDTQYKTAWKKIYAELSQVTMKMVSDYGGSIKGICNNNDDICLRNLYLKYLSYTRSCDSLQNFGNCWHNLNSFWYLDGTPTNWTNNAGAILNNGMLFFIYNNSINCTAPNGSLKACGGMMVDVNGFKPPNKFGKDIFIIHILENSLAPFGAQGDGLENTCQGSTGESSGYGCSAKYLYQ